jgi:murein DD-endopeptidase MepM/ murein hydrolase activator NlpD
MDASVHRIVSLALVLAWMPWALADEPVALRTEARDPGAAMALYRLPYPDGAAFMISQGLGGFITTHTTKESRHAVDISMPEGTPVVAAREGIVIATEWRHDAGGRSEEYWTRGNAVRVRHPDGTIGSYFHFMHAGVAVEVGEYVQAGKILGYAGSTGFSSGPHLHFAVTRTLRSGGGLEEVSEPITFYVGNPPRAFAPRAGLAVTANYAFPGDALLPVRSVTPRIAMVGPAPPPGEIVKRWARLAVMFALTVFGLCWFYRFSRS